MATFVPSSEQNVAIQYNGDMVIIARPGSGKTSVLSCKVRNKISELRSYQGIIAISFTNKASDELERRCKANAFNIKASFFGTIDDFCLREIIFPFAKQVLFMPAEVKTAKMEELPESVLKMLPSTPIGDCNVANIIRFMPFIKEAFSQGLIPLEAIGMISNYLMEESLSCQKYLVARYRAVYIDEYQDSGYFQHQLFKNLKVLGLNAVAVGDGDQSIYAFAKKDSKYLFELTERDSGFAHFSISTNFRCHPSINEFALRLLNPNYQALPNQDMRVLIKSVNGDQKAIGRWLKTAIPHLMNHYQIAQASKVAVLCRHQHSARLIANNLGLTYRIFEDTPFKKAPTNEVTILTDLLKLRYDISMTAESIIDKTGSFKRNYQSRRALRKTILSCRTCYDNVLKDKVKAAAECLIGQQLSPTSVTELEDICNNSSKLNWFEIPKDNAIQIMTLHKSKGLEFDLVFHADLYDHVIPTRIYPPGTFGQIIFANEVQCLNLHYVGVTRAVKACVLITSNYRINGSGDVKNAEPSQFIGRNGTTAIPITW